MLEPLGQSQVLAYLQKLSQSHHFYLISFEKKEDWGRLRERSEIERRIKAAGIHWYPLRYHKNPSFFATILDIINGLAVGLFLVFMHKIGIVHARSYVASVIAILIKQLTGTRFVFDMRGFWADERVDGNIWIESGRMYRIAKWCEAYFLRKADHVVSLTHAAVRIMQSYEYLQDRMPPFTVIPTCADLQKFKTSPRSRKEGELFVLGYLGTVGTWYLFDEVAKTAAALIKLIPNAKFLIVNRDEHDYIQQRLTKAGVPDSSVEIVSASPDRVPALISRMHAGIFFIKPVFSKQASAPTKLAEFLGCGIPCLANSGVGDMAEVLRENRVGVAVDRFDTESLITGLHQLLALTVDHETRQRCIDTAYRYFSLEDGVKKYRKIYESL